MILGDNGSISVEDEKKKEKKLRLESLFLGNENEKRSVDYL